MILVTTQVIAGTLVATLHLHRLDAAAASALRERLLPTVGSHNRVVLAMQEVAFIDSWGLGSLVSILKHLPSGGSVRLTGLQGGVRSLLRLTRLDRVFATFPSIADALAD